MTKLQFSLDKVKPTLDMMFTRLGTVNTLSLLKPLDLLMLGAPKNGGKFTWKPNPKTKTRNRTQPAGLACPLLEAHTRLAISTHTSLPINRLVGGDLIATTTNTAYISDATDEQLDEFANLHDFAHPVFFTAARGRDAFNIPLVVAMFYYTYKTMPSITYVLEWKPDNPLPICMSLAGGKFLKPQDEIKEKERVALVQSLKNFSLENGT